MNSVRFLILLLVMSLASGAVFAQTPALDSDAVPHVDLSAAQKQTVYQSIRNLQKNNARSRAFERRSARLCRMACSWSRCRQLPSPS
jgi:hypothetical protein